MGIYVKKCLKVERIFTSSSVGAIEYLALEIAAVNAKCRFVCLPNPNRNRILANFFMNYMNFQIIMKIYFFVVSVTSTLFSTTYVQMNCEILYSIVWLRTCQSLAYAFCPQLQAPLLDHLCASDTYLVLLYG